MASIILKSLEIENFKGCKNLTVNFGHKTIVSGQNASGKTTIFDALTWLLFDKDSNGSAKFSIRPLDKDGGVIHFVDISVIATFEIDNEIVTLRKIQKENWVKTRGTQEQVFKGNVNEYEILGYPKSEKDFKSYVSDIVDEKMFRMITDPMAFTSLPWKEQREVLFKLLSNFSDIELAQKDTRFTPLISELKVASVDDIKGKYLKAKKGLVDRQTEIPARIDEVSKLIVDVDTAELELAKNTLLEEIDKLKKDDLALLDVSASYEQKAGEIMNLKFKLSDMQREANAALVLKKNDLHRIIADKMRNLDDIRTQISQAKVVIANTNSAIETLESERTRYKAEYSKASATEFDGSTNCPFCGQELPKEMIDEKIDAFEKKKAGELARIVALGNEVADKIENAKQKLNEQTIILEQQQKSISSLESEILSLKAELDNLPVSVNVSESPEYIALALQVTEKEKAVNDLDSINASRAGIRNKIDELYNELNRVNGEIAKADCSAAENRRDELQAELRQVSQKIADNERMIELVEDFIRLKMDYISSMINDKFNLVNFKLFSNQINGGIAECCECTLNGVPYSALNNGHKIVAGLDIISTLSAIYGVSAPIFVDNAESVNDYNFPDTDSQIILLKVSDDKSLIISNN